MNAITVLTVAAAAAAVAAAAEDFELQFVAFVHRHGDRSPVGTYANDPFGNESLWNNGWGELTTAGKQRAYALGKWLRQRYADFLPKTYDKRDYEVRSTDVSRTLMSAYLVLSGLYEPSGTDVWHPDIRWQPIPVHTTPVDLDEVLAAGKPCPRHARLQLQLLLSEEITSRLDPLKETLSEIVAHAGYNTTNVLADFLTATFVYDSLNVQDQNGLQLPEWTRPYFPQPLRDLGSLALRLSTYNRPLQRLSCGPLVDDILRHFDAKSRGVLEKKVWQYSAHDATIVALRQCLGFRETDSPPYASSLLLELGSINDDYFVKVLYKTDEALRTMVIPGCTEYCPLEKFHELMAPVIPEDWEAECDL